MLDKKEYDKKHYEKNKEKILRQTKEYRKNNLEKIREKSKLYYENNKEKIIKYYQKNKEHRKKYMKQYRKENINKLNEYINEWCKNKYKTDLKYNLANRINRIIRKSLKGNKSGRHWETLVGYALNDLFKRLQRTIPKGYNWNDFLQGNLHIDHIIPISVFNFTKTEHIDFRRCWALENLRLLPKEENLKKSNKLTKSFQPALAI